MVITIKLGYNYNLFFKLEIYFHKKCYSNFPTFKITFIKLF